MKKALKQSTISNVLSIITISLVVILTIIGLAFTKAGEAVLKSSEDMKALTEAAETFMEGSEELTNSVRGYVASQDMVYYLNYWTELSEKKNRETAVMQMMDIGLNQNEMLLIHEMAAISDSLIPLELEALENVKEGNVDLAREAVYGKHYNDSIERIEEIKAELHDDLEKRLNKEIEAVKEKSLFYKYCFISLSLIVVLMQLTYSFIFNRQIIKPLIQIRDQMTDISKGMLDSEFRLSPNTSEVGLIVNAIDQTKRNLKDYTDNLEKLAFTDTITGLPNMQYLIYKVEEFVMSSEVEIEELTIIAIDIKQFSGINNTFGFAKGNSILMHVSDMIKSVAGEGILIRASADKFFLVYWNGDEDFINRVPVRIQKLFIKPQAIEDIHQLISFRFGVARDKIASSSVTKILTDAEIALEYTKTQSDEDICFINDEIREVMKGKLKMEIALSRAVYNKEFYLVFQPQIDIKTGKVNHAEALIRWNSPVFGIVSPVDFIPIAEDTNLIVEIGDFVMEETARQLSEWLKKGIDVSLSFNVSAKQFLDPLFEEKITNICSVYNIPTENINVEVTESFFIYDVNSTLDLLKRLKNIGVRIILDDFGTGYSSLKYLEKLPLDGIKIDRSFLNAAIYSQKSKYILETIIDLANKIDLMITVEGVETQEQIDMLSVHQCDYYQGYFFSVPLKTEDFEEFYNKRNSGEYSSLEGDRMYP